MGRICTNHLQALITHLLFVAKRLEVVLTNSAHEFFIKTLAVLSNPLSSKAILYPCCNENFGKLPEFS